MEEKRAVKTPLRMSPREAKTPCSSPCCMAVDVPTACEAVPIDSPWESGWLMRQN